MKRLIALSLAAVVAAPALAGDLARKTDDETPANILYVVRVTDPVPGASETVRSVRATALSGTRTRLQSGWRIPIRLQAGSAGEAAPTLQYHEVGISASLWGRIVGDDQLRVGGEIELSTVPEGEGLAPSAPRVGTVSHRFEVLLDGGEETRLAEVARPDGTVLTLAISASIVN